MLEWGVRDYVVEHFSKAISPYMNSIASIAIVGGSPSDPEMQAFSGKSVTIQTIGIEETNDVFMDLNLPISRTLDGRSGVYDLILCSQVFEHLFDIKHALANLNSLTKDNGFIWLGFPASNRAHGSPEYYSAGYQPEIITKLVESMQLNLKILDAGLVGSKRYYFMNHALQVWANKSELARPILRYDFRRLPGPKYKNYLRFIRDFPGRAYACFVRNEISDDVRWASESFILLKKS